MLTIAPSSAAELSSASLDSSAAPIERPHRPLSPSEAALITKELAAQAFEIARPTLQALINTPGVSGERALHVVVLAPDQSLHEHALEQGHASAPSAPAVLFEAPVGDPSLWNADYAAYAHGKARLASRLRRDTEVAAATSPHLLRPNDTMIGGGIYRDGLVCAASGAFPWFDVACAEMLASLIKALAHDRLTALREKS